MNMKNFLFMFEGLISNNKEQINIAPSPQGTPLTINKENKNPPIFDVYGNFSI